MATNYDIYVQTYAGEDHSDTITSDLRAELTSLERDENFGLGHRVGTWSDPHYKDDPYCKVRWYYYHNGRICVTTRYQQLTANQRQGRRSY